MSSARPPQSSNDDVSQARVALVTGSSSGIGLATSVALARRGFLTYGSVREKARADHLIAAMNAVPAASRIVYLNLTEPDSIEGAISEVIKETGRLDVLINNAGYRLEGFLEDTTLEELRNAVEANLVGLIATTKAVIPIMRQQRSGSIINVSCSSGHVAYPGASVFCATKFALEGFSESLRHELRPYGIRVSVVVPGPVNTAFYDRNLKIATGAHSEHGPNFEMMRRISFAADIATRYSSNKVEEVGEAIAAIAAAGRPPYRSFVGGGTGIDRWLRRVLPFEIWERVVWRRIRPRT